MQCIVGWVTQRGYWTPLLHSAWWLGGLAQVETPSSDAVGEVLAVCGCLQHPSLKLAILQTDSKLAERGVAFDVVDVLKPLHVIAMAKKKKKKGGLHCKAE